MQRQEHNQRDDQSTWDTGVTLATGLMRTGDMDNDAGDGDVGHDADINDKLLLTTTTSSMIDYSLLQTRIVQSIFLRCILSILCSCCFKSYIDSGVCL